MGVWQARWQGGLIAGLISLALTGSARADEVALNWVRLDGAEGCIDAPRLAKLVEARIGRAVLQSSSRADLSIEARVGPEDNGGYHALIAVHARDGSLIGQRELKVGASPCSQLDAPAALIISLIVEPNAAGPGLMAGGAASPVAERLLAQLDLPSAAPDSLLTPLDFSAEAREHSPRASAVDAVSVPASKAKATPVAPAQHAVPATTIVSVIDDGLQPLRAQRRERLVSAEPRSSTVQWPGYVLLGLAGVAAGSATYATLRINSLNNDPDFTRLRNATPAAMGVTDVCVAARAGRPLNLDPSERASLVDMCNDGSVLTVLFWVSAVTTIVSAATGAAWLIWIANDGGQNAEHKPTASVSLVPYGLGAALHMRM